MTGPLTFFEFTCQPLNVDEITAAGNELFASLPWEDDNPFVEEDGGGGGVFMRFEGLLIRNSDQAGVNVGFVWRGRAICFVHVEGPRLEKDNDVLLLRGIEGRQRVMLS